MAKKMARLWQKGLSSAQRLNQSSNGWLGMTAGAAREALKPEATITAAAIAYFSLFSLFPIILLSIAIASFSLGPLMDYNVVIQRLEFVAPALGQMLGQNIEEIIQARGPITGVAFVGLIWTASNIFYTLTQTLSAIWGNQRRRAVWKRRGISILFVLVFVGPALFAASIASSMFANLRTWLPDSILVIGDGISFIVAILFDVALFMVIYIMLPHGDAGWRQILPGAIGAGLLWEMAKKAFLLFVSTYLSASNLIYGSVAAIIAFLAWAYLSSHIFLFGAFLSVAYYQQKRPQQTAVRPQ